jgi:dTDP-4-dehydrorhamnose reductase
MRVLVTGAAGMLGTDVCAALKTAGHEPLPTDLVGDTMPLDITDAGAVRETVVRLRPDAVLHCAAYTNVDGAERDPDAAYRVNALGSWTVAAACAAQDVPLCAISTDFVFDGAKTEPYTEFDAPNPLNHYGASKLAGENRVREICRRHWIVRTAWLYGLHGKSFPNTILTAAETRPELRVIADQRGSPTFTEDLAKALLWIIRSPLYGTYHVTNAGAITWYEFARRALELAGMGHVKVVPITSGEWPSPTRRPANSALRPYALELQNVPLPRPWEEALAEFVRKRAELRGK